MHSLNGISILVAGTFIRNANRRTGVKFCGRSSTAFKRRFLGRNLQIHPTSFRWWEPIVEWTLSNGDWLTPASSLFNNSFYYRTSTSNEQRLASPVERRIWFRGYRDKFYHLERVLIFLRPRTLVYRERLDVSVLRGLFVSFQVSRRSLGRRLSLPSFLAWLFIFPTGFLATLSFAVKVCRSICEIVLYRSRRKGRLKKRSWNGKNMERKGP